MGGHTIVRTVICGQGLVACACALVWWLAQDGYAALAALAGGGIAIIPGLYMGMKVLSVPADAEPKQVLGAFYRGEAVKFGLTVVLFIVALQWFASTFAPVIVTYILALLVYWLALQGGAATQR